MAGTDITKGVKLLSSIFSGKYIRYQKREFVDIIDYMFAYWVYEGRQLPMDGNISSVYGEFLWMGTVRNMLDEFENENPGFITDVEKTEEPRFVYEERNERFRSMCIRRIVSEILGEEDMDEYVGKTVDSDEDNYVTYNDIGSFFGLITKNKIWGDKELQNNKHNAYFYKHVLEVNNWMRGVNDITASLLEENIERNPTVLLDFFDARIYFTKEFEALEKINRKKSVDEKYHHAIDALDLTALKQNLIDPISGQCFTPLGWQGEFLLHHKRFNFIAGSRRIGKTFLGAGYLSIRQMSIPGQIVIYIVPTKENHAKPAWRDMELYFKRFENIRMVGGNRLSVYNDDMKSELHFISAEKANAVRGNAANLLIFDEAAFISERVYDTATPLIRTTKGMVYCISTVNPDTPKNYFYYNLVEAEVDMHQPDSQLYAKRVDLLQNPFISETDKKDIVARESHKPTFDAEWMANFADVNEFNMKNFWVVDWAPKEVKILSKYPTYWRDEVFDAESNYYERYIISYDWAKRKDKPGISVIGVARKPITKEELKAQKSIAFADIVCSAYIEAGDYFEHVDYCYDIHKMLKLQGKPIDIIIDYGGAGVAVEEIFERLNKWVNVDAIMAVWGLSAERDWNVWRVGKELMVSKLRSFMELWWLRGFSFMNQLRLEFETYTDEKGVRVKWHHWDMISSLYQAVWFIDRMGYLDSNDLVTTKWEIHMQNDFDWSDSSPVWATIKPRNTHFSTMGKFGY